MSSSLESSSSDSEPDSVYESESADSERERRDSFLTKLLRALPFAARPPASFFTLEAAFALPLPLRAARFFGAGPSSSVSLWPFFMSASGLTSAPRAALGSSQSLMIRATTCESDVSGHGTSSRCSRRTCSVLPRPMPSERMPPRGRGGGRRVDSRKPMWYQ